MSAKDKFNRARREKLEKHDCWNCGYFPMNCNPNDKKCKKNLEKEEK